MTSHVASGQPQAVRIATRQGLAIGQGRVDAGLQEAAITQDAREHAQLPDGSGTLTFQAPPRQPTLGHAAIDQIVAEIEDVGSYGLQKGGTCLERGLAIGVQSLGGERASAFNHLRRSRGEVWADGFACSCLYRLPRLAASGGGLGTDQVLSTQIHGLAP